MKYGINKKCTKILYHGNKDINMQPKYGVGKKNNDYGQGFYTTPDLQLAKEWAYSGYTSGLRGYVHSYALDINGLNILDFTQLDSMHWLAELLVNRNISKVDTSEIVVENIKKVISKYKLDTTYYDIIIGYRADDSYFSYATDFVSGLIYRETLDKALHLGKLGLQVFIKSKKGFEALKY